MSDVIARTPPRDIPQTAKYLGVSETTVRRLIAQGILPHIRISLGGSGRGTIRTLTEDLDAFLRSQRVRAS